MTIQDRYVKEVVERASALPPEEMFKDPIYQHATRVPTRQGDFTYGLDWERVHGPTDDGEHLGFNSYTDRFETGGDEIEFSDERDF
jgi:hypothetical protein